LVTGPHKVNGVPLRRINQVYTIPTQTKVSLAGVNADSIDDAYFAKTVTKKAAKSEQAFFAVNQTEKTPEEKARLADKKKKQAEVDASLIKNVKAVPLLKGYLSARFTISNKTRPHDLVFWEKKKGN